jgi:hypothetical protein
MKKRKKGQYLNLCFLVKEIAALLSYNQLLKRSSNPGHAYLK